ncbi:hypothetical protein PCANC_24692 [Puccinia coronata f. sp. avenae]|uniref:Uncharacterized protein n=1 Tax=Puccinia coronata f. sp. avenae TaxID=200324 RepID=A0A2N5TJK4_9BASI|nr:hypothetical protein PCANC_24692 [Puccinia coronata f. sp. avenae]
MSEQTVRAEHDFRGGALLYEEVIQLYPDAIPRRRYGTLGKSDAPNRREAHHEAMFSIFKVDTLRQCGSPGHHLWGRA